jgi:hypothetical protein
MTVINVRLAIKLNEQLKLAALKAHRSKNGELVVAIENHLRALGYRVATPEEPAGE